MDKSPLQLTLINLVEQISFAIGSEFRLYLPQLIPNILRVLAHDTSSDKAITLKVSLFDFYFIYNFDFFFFSGQVKLKIL